ncbi:MAG: WYL domain-containing protein [Burkholderiales bacterium]
MAELPQQDGVDDATRRRLGSHGFTAQQMRHLQILRHLNTTGQPASTSELWAAVGGKNAIAKRNVQRDLEHMAEFYDLVCEERGRTKLWSVKPGAKPKFVLPVLDQDAALAFILAKELLSEFLPDNAFGALKPWFAESEALLQKSNPQNPWYQRLVSKREGMALEPPVINARMLDTVYEALRDGGQLIIQYVKPDKILNTRQVSPAGIVASNQTLYLLTYAADNEDDPYRGYALHRVTSAVRAYTPATVPDVQAFQDYVKDEFNQFFLFDDEIRLVADFHPVVQRKLEEYQLSNDQHTAMLADGWLRVKATVYATGALQTWLLGYGNLVRVNGPQKLLRALDAMRQPPPPPPSAVKPRRRPSAVQAIK